MEVDCEITTAYLLHFALECCAVKKCLKTYKEDTVKVKF